MRRFWFVLGSAAVVNALFVGQSFAQSTAAPKDFQSDIFRKRVLLMADGKPIDTGEAWGHSGPTIA